MLLDERIRQGHRFQVKNRKPSALVASSPGLQQDKTLQQGESLAYVQQQLGQYYRRSPDQISDEKVQAYLLHLIRD